MILLACGAAESRALSKLDRTWFFTSLDEGCLRVAQRGAVTMSKDRLTRRCFLGGESLIQLSGELIRLLVRHFDFAIEQQG